MFDPSTLRGLIFDMDDTLYPEQEYVLSGFKAVAEWGEEHLDIAADLGFAELENLFLQGVRGKSFNLWLTSHQLDMALIPELVSVYRTHKPNIKPFPQIRNLLDTTKEHWRLGLVSDGYLSVQKKKFNALCLEKYFDAVVFSDEFGRQGWKPSLLPFQKVLKSLDISGEEAVYIADNPTKDFLGAHRAGLSTIWAKYSQGDYTRLEPPTPDYAADVVANSIEQLILLLGLEPSQAIGKVYHVKT